MSDINKPSQHSRRFGRYTVQVEPVFTDPVIRGYFTLVISFLLTAFFIFFALSPTFSTIVGLFRKIDDQEKAVTALDSKISDLITAQENYSLVQADIPLLETAVPTKPEPEAILDYVNVTATSAGVVLTSLQIGDVYLSGINPPKLAPVSEVEAAGMEQSPLAAVKLPTVNFTIGVKGTEPEIRSFIGTLTKLPRILTLTEISITTDEEGNIETGEVTGQISGSAFFSPGKQIGEANNEL